MNIAGECIWSQSLYPEDRKYLSEFANEVQKLVDVSKKLNAVLKPPQFSDIFPVPLLVRLSCSDFALVRVDSGGVCIGMVGQDDARQIMEKAIYTYNIQKDYVKEEETLALMDSMLSPCEEKQVITETPLKKQFDRQV